MVATADKCVQGDSESYLRSVCYMMLLIGHHHRWSQFIHTEGIENTICLPPRLVIFQEEVVSRGLLL